MRKIVRNWVVVADSGQAHLFATDENETRLIPLELPGVPVAEVAHHARDLASDRPGRSFSSAGGGIRHAIEPHHDYRKQEKHNFVAALAESLNVAFQAKKYDRLVLVTPPRTLGEFRQLLSAPVQAGMEVVGKDLTAATTDTLWSEVGPIVHRRPVTPAR
jgi:protein required for attachment to host cells